MKNVLTIMKVKMKHLFVYGSLMFDEVLSPLVKGHYKKSAAELRGYTRMALRGECYPGLIARQQGRVQGILILHISTADLLLLDEFEGSYYKRIPVTVYCENEPVNAETYVFRDRFRHLLSESEWCPETFRRRFLRKFVDRYVAQLN
jgi:gamma-glutamylcyclotransferase (GGCT)/AIG2-like uncharacterized protein YtfP